MRNRDLPSADKVVRMQRGRRVNHRGVPTALIGGQIIVPRDHICPVCGDEPRPAPSPPFPPGTPSGILTQIAGEPAALVLCGACYNRWLRLNVPAVMRKADYDEWRANGFPGASEEYVRLMQARDEAEAQGASGSEDDDGDAGE